MRMRCGAKTCVEINQCVVPNAQRRLPALEEAPPRHPAVGVEAFALRGKDYEYAWCVEHDVALTGGNWLGFYEAHANDRRDLLAWRVGWVPKDAKPHKGEVGTRA